jgi:predicted nucleotidyltransferase
MLTEKQREVADKVLAQEEAKRRHLVVSLSGAHAYGFPSPDSDLDLKAIHIAPTESLLSLAWEHRPAERLEVIDGVEIDYSSNEIREVLIGILKGNGNYLERIHGHLQPLVSKELEELKPMVQESVSKNLHRHYAGFAAGQLKEWEKTKLKSAKKLLYVLRTTLTGTHALLTGKIVTDLREHMDLYGFGAARALIEQKTRGELAELPEALAEQWRVEIQRAFTMLDDALRRSPLPDEPKNAKAIDAWLLQKRRDFW